VASVIIDTRNNPVMPKGINWITTARHLSGMKDIDYKVTQLNSELTVFLNIAPKVLQIANRVGGGHNFGDFEFYQAQYLGNEDHLRGFRKYRFAGRSKLFNNTEIRWAAAKFRTYLFPGSLGFLAFYDVGRVWADNDNSNKWQSGYGVGFWIAPLNRILLNFTFTASKEDKLPLFSLKWKF
jgi:hemolysin activation/secretion protein